jgi:hypothetical protein
VIKLNSVNDNSASGAEEQAARAMGLDFEYLPMSMHRLPARQEMLRLVDLLEHAPRPILIHCNAGADRTGMASVLVAMQNGQSFEQAIGQLSIRYLHVGIAGEDVDEIFEQYIDDCRNARRPTGGWTQFKQYIEHDYWPGFYHAKIEAGPAVPLGSDGSRLRVDVRVTNLSGKAWPADRGHPIELAAYVTDESGRRMVLARSELGAVGPGQTMNAQLTWASEAAGDHTVMLDVLQRAVTWFGQRGSEEAVVNLRGATTRATTMRGATTREAIGATGGVEGNR